MSARSVMIEDVNLLRGQFRNFAGEERPFNKLGDRNFCIGLSPELAEELAEDGYNVKVREPREEGDEALCYLKVFVNYKYREQPRVYLVTSRGKRELTEDTVGLIDYAEISRVDMSFRPYDWEVNGNAGRKPMLKGMYVHVVEDDLDLLYAETPDLEF